MPARKTLYLLRRPIVDSTQSLLPSVPAASSSDTLSLVLLEEAVSSSPSFPGQIYMLQPASGGSAGSVSIPSISYQDLVMMITEHDAIIVL
ncbi:MAG: hypothetical protein H0X01_02115 [Nitrospira sp.]|nr:hypothetical protein [Nitrospira sp.]